MRGALSRMLNHSPAIRNKRLKRMCKIYLSEEGCEKVNDKEAAEFKDVAIMRHRELTLAAQED